jgi:hypothetical protein
MKASYLNDPYLNSLLGTNEKILLECRQHWFVFVRNIFVEGIAIAAIFALVTFILVVLAPSPEYNWVAYGYALVIFPIISLVFDFFQWWNRKYIITDFRVIQISGIINKDVIDSALEKINDVKLTQSFFGRIFNFGTIEILTASEIGINKISTLGSPIRFKTTMINAKEDMDRDDDHGRRGGAAPKVANDIPTMIAQLDNLRAQGILSSEEFQVKKEELLRRL